MQQIPRRDDRVALLDTLTSKFPVSLDDLAFGPHRFSFASISNPHDNIDQLMGREVNDDYQWEPFWAQAWPSAQSLATWMISEPNKDCWSERKVLDLGCGVGLNGCVAAAQGALVSFADYAEPSLLFAQYNSWNWRDRVSCFVVDWHKDDMQQKFDIILGADIVYEQRNWQALDKFFRNHLSAGGRIVLTEPGRDTGEAVQGFLEKQNWKIQVSEIGKTDTGRPLRLLMVTS